MPGPSIRTDILEVYVFRRPNQRSGQGVEFLQLHRCKGPIANTWQPVMGHIEEGETAVQAALRELAEETGFKQAAGLTGFWQLESINSYFLAARDAVMLSPGFAAEVSLNNDPTLDASHDTFRWVPRDKADTAFLWPGQRHAIHEIVREILPPDAPAASLLRLPL
jgi:8-oxo-dGTP pyrophosphatase MutT (NUDIX family)